MKKGNKQLVEAIITKQENGPIGRTWYHICCNVAGIIGILCFKDNKLFYAK